jgi:hypothetical protein
MLLNYGIGDMCHSEKHREKIRGMPVSACYRIFI